MTRMEPPGESDSVEQVFRVALGSQLRTTRRAQGLAETELASKAGLGADVIAAVERGESSPTLDTLRRWVVAGFGMRLADFLAQLEPAVERDDEGELVQIFRDAQPGVRRLILRMARTLALEEL